MREVVIVDAVRTPVGRRNGGLSAMHSVDLLGAVQRAVLDACGRRPARGRSGRRRLRRTGRDAGDERHPQRVARRGAADRGAATTVDAQCGSSQQATNLAHALVASASSTARWRAGSELMSRVPMGSTIPKDPNVGKPINRNYWAHHEFTSQFEGAERIAEKWHHPRRLRRVRQAVPGPGRARVGRRPLRHPDPRIDAPDVDE